MAPRVVTIFFLPARLTSWRAVCFLAALFPVPCFWGRGLSCGHPRFPLWDFLSSLLDDGGRMQVQTAWRGGGGIWNVMCLRQRRKTVTSFRRTALTAWNTLGETSILRGGEGIRSLAIPAPRQAPHPNPRRKSHEKTPVPAKISPSTGQKILRGAILFADRRRENVSASIPPFFLSD